MKNSRLQAGHIDNGLLVKLSHIQIKDTKIKIHFVGIRS